MPTNIQMLCVALWTFNCWKMLCVRGKLSANEGPTCRSDRKRFSSPAPDPGNAVGPRGTGLGMEFLGK